MDTTAQHRPALIRWIGNAMGSPFAMRSVVDPSDVVFAMAGGKGEPPPPSQQELDFYDAQAEATRQSTTVAQQQLDLAQQQQRENEALQPLMYQQQGLVRTVDPETGDVSFQMTPEAQAAQERERQYSSTRQQLAQGRT